MKLISALTAAAATAVVAAPTSTGSGYFVGRFVLRVPRQIPCPVEYKNATVSFDMMDAQLPANETSITRCMAMWDSNVGAYPSDGARVSLSTKRNRHD